MPRLNTGQLRYSGLTGKVGSGRGMGDIVFGSTSPGNGFVLANGQEISSAAYPNFYKGTRLFKVAPGEIQADAAGTASTRTIKVGTEFWFSNLNTPGSIFKKTAYNAEPTTVASSLFSGATQGIFVGVVNNTALCCFYNGSNWTMMASTVSPGFASGWANTSYAAKSYSVNDVLWTGTSYIIGAGVGMYRIVGSSLTGTLTTPTISGVMTSVTGNGWYKFWKIGGTIYAWTDNNWFAKSTDDGATWVSFAATAPSSYTVTYYSTTFGLFLHYNYGASTPHLYTSVTPDGTWTDIGAFSVGFSKGMVDITDPVAILITGDAGYAIYYPTENQIVKLTSGYNGLASYPETVSEYAPGKILTHGWNGRHYKLKMPSDAVTVPNISNAGGRTAYIKVTG